MFVRVKAHLAEPTLSQTRLPDTCVVPWHSHHRQDDSFFFLSFGGENKLIEK